MGTILHVFGVKFQALCWECKNAKSSTNIDFSETRRCWANQKTAKSLSFTCHLDNSSLKISFDNYCSARDFVQEVGTEILIKLIT